MDIREYLRSNLLLGDGAFGTYYMEDEGHLSDMPEKANLEDYGRVKAIHKAYIEAGAKLIRTNTFASNSLGLKCNQETLGQNLQAGYQAAVEAVQESLMPVFIAGDIGPVDSDEREVQDTRAEYLFIAQNLIAAGADILLFETFAELDILKPVLAEIKSIKDVFIIVQFCVNQYGYTEKGISIQKLLESSKEVTEIDAIGFNCGIGPGHLYNLLKKQDLNIGKYLTSFPNASHPQMLNDRLMFLDNSRYFKEKQQDILDLGINIFGGCCGTAPKYTKLLKTLELRVICQPQNRTAAIAQNGSDNGGNVQKKAWFEKEGKIIAVELDPPMNGNDGKILEAANYLKNAGVDILTFADSPNGKRRADSIMMSIKVANQVGIEVMPHICCRDKNSIAMSSQILGAHMNGIRNVLVITGDPVPSANRKEIKSVFNFDSVKLMNHLKEMNQEYFGEDQIRYGGAVNYVRNIVAESGRMDKKEAVGSEFFLTQPVFSKEDVERLRELKANRNGKMLVGIMPLISFRNAWFIQNEIAGIRVPDEVLNQFHEGMSRAEGESAGVALARDILTQTADFADGYYFIFPFNRVYLIEQITAGLI